MSAKLRAWNRAPSAGLRPRCSGAWINGTSACRYSAAHAHTSLAATMGLQPCRCNASAIARRRRAWPSPPPSSHASRTVLLGIYGEARLIATLQTCRCEHGPVKGKEGNRCFSTLPLRQARCGGVLVTNDDRVGQKFLSCDDAEASP